MKGLILVLVVALAGCASRTGVMWGSVVELAPRNVSLAIYHANREFCDGYVTGVRSTSPYLHGLAWPACERYAVVSYDEMWAVDATQIYWSSRLNGAQVGFAGDSARPLCEGMQSRFFFTSGCKAVVVMPLR